MRVYNKWYKELWWSIVERFSKPKKRVIVVTSEGKWCYEMSNRIFREVNKVVSPYGQTVKLRKKVLDALTHNGFITRRKEMFDNNSDITLEGVTFDQVIIDEISSCTPEAKRHMKKVHKDKGVPNIKKVSINSKIGKLKGFMMEDNTCVRLPFTIKPNTEYELLLSEEDTAGQREVISWKEVHKEKGRLTEFEKKYKVDIGGVEVDEYLRKSGLPSLAKTYKKLKKGRPEI